MLPEYLGNPFASEKITLTGSPLGLTAATYKVVGRLARNAVITTDVTTDWRFVLDGVATVSATDGHLVKAATNHNPIVLRGFDAISKFRALGAGAVIYVTYFA